MARQKIAKRPKKRVILFIVEGESDKAALENPIQNLLAINKSCIEATFLIAKHDVTSDNRVTIKNIEQRLNDIYFRGFFSANEFYYPKDILEVVHIVDLDGTFIPEENCRAFDEEHFAEKGFVYDPPYVYGNTTEAVINRNRKKAENIKYLITLNEIKVCSKTCPYSVFFFSSNIDHYLYDKLNLITREKLDRARNFAIQCDQDSEYLIKRICRHSQALKNMSYDESWAYIMKETNSSKRHTNFNIYLEKLLGYIRDEKQ